MVNRFFNFLMSLSCVLMVTSCQSGDFDALQVAESFESYVESTPFKQNVGNFYDSTTYETYVHKLSRSSAVRVQIEYGGATVYGSGTYVKWKGNHMVVTAAHLFAFGGGTVNRDEAVITSPSEKVFGELVYIDEYVDIAVFAIPALKSRNPAKFNRARSFEIGDPVVYSGFPGPNQLLTFDGTLSGAGFGTDITIHSFAWPGSSGSGVYNSKGELLGVVVAIMVGGGPSGSQLIGSVIYVAPATLIDSAQLLQNLDKSQRTDNAGF